MPTLRSTVLATVLFAAGAFAPAASAQGDPPSPPAQGPGGAPKAAPKPAPPTAINQPATESLVRVYRGATNWTLQSLAMLSLGDDWHPAGAAMLVEALRGKDVRLHAFAVEEVLRTGKRVLPCVATPELIDALVETLAAKNPHLRARTVEALAHLLPEAQVKKPDEWKRWWAEHRATHAPAEWTSIAADPPGGTAAQRLVQRAIDLHDAGLQLVFVVDSTGSMQVAIDAVRDAVEEVSAVLAGVTEQLELGLVHYKDDGDMKDAADLLVPLTKNHKLVREKLAKLVAGGGGDIPERIEAGIAVALDKATGWDKDKNRMLLVIGDAPPHPESEFKLLELVKRAYEQPFAVGKGAVTGPQAKAKARPFVTSAIATNPTVKEAFEAIAKAGGGACAVMNLGPQPGHRPGAPPSDPKPRGKEKEPEKGKDGAPEPAKVGAAATAARQVAAHVLLLSFGAGYEAQLRVFVDVFFAYRDAGLF